MAIPKPPPTHGHLVLSRRPGQKVIISHPAGPIEIEVINIIGQRVQLGIKAPLSVTVHREEIWKLIQAEKQGCGTAALSAEPSARALPT